MAHTRTRKYNTREMYPGKDMDNDLCMAVRAGNRVFLRGQTGFDLDGNFVGAGDPAAQADNAMKCVKILPEEAGAKPEHICRSEARRGGKEWVSQLTSRWSSYH